MKTILHEQGIKARPSAAGLSSWGLAEKVSWSGNDELGSMGLSEAR